MFLPTYVFYAFLNSLSDCEDIWYRDGLDLGEEHRIAFVTIKVNTRSNSGTFSDRHFCF